MMVLLPPHYFPQKIEQKYKINKLSHKQPKLFITLYYTNTNTVYPPIHIKTCHSL